MVFLIYTGYMSITRESRTRYCVYARIWQHWDQVLFFQDVYSKIINIIDAHTGLPQEGA
jgi:hypothetical protein